MVQTKSPRRYAGRSQTERVHERRARLLAAGRQLFGRQGYPATTVKVICEEAGLTERYFYESFQNREALLTAVYQALAAELEARLRAAAATAPATLAGVAEATLRAFFAGLRDRPGDARVLYVEIMGVSPALNEAYRKSTAAFANLILEMARPLFADGRLPGPDPALLAAGLVGAVNSILLHWMLDDFARPLETVVATSMELFLALSRHLLDGAMPAA